MYNVVLRIIAGEQVWRQSVGSRAVPRPGDATPRGGRHRGDVHPPDKGGRYVLHLRRVVAVMAIFVVEYFMTERASPCIIVITTNMQ